MAPPPDSYGGGVRCLPLALVLLVACEPPIVEEPLRPDPLDRTFPQTWEELPGCGTEGEDVLEIPDEDWGKLDLRIEGPMAPVDRTITLRIKLGVDSLEAPDPGVDPEFSLEPADAGTLGPWSYRDGSLYADLVIGREGPFVVDARLGEDRAHRERRAYRSVLPVWELTLDEAEFDVALEDPSAEHWVDFALAAADEQRTGELRLHGGSSRHWRKKSLRLNLDEELEGREKLILRAEWADKTMLRNWLAMQMLRNGTWLPAPEVDFVHVRVNGVFYGLMLQTERVDGDYLWDRGFYRDGSLYEADPPSELSVPGGALLPLNSREEYEQVYQHHQGVIPYDDLLELAEWYLQLPDEELEPVLDDLVATDALTLYTAFMTVIQNHDHVRKNYYLYRDVRSEEGRWLVLPWDLDITFGHLWTEENDILDEQMFVDGDPWAGTKRPEHNFYNQLIERTLRVDRHRAAHLGHVQRLLGSVFTPEFVDGRLDNALCRILPEFASDTGARAHHDEFVSRVDEIRQWVPQRADFLSGALEL